MLSHNNIINSDRPCISVSAPAPPEFPSIMNDGNGLLLTHLHRGTPNHKYFDICYMNKLANKQLSTKSSNSPLSATSVPGIFNDAVASSTIEPYSQISDTTAKMAHTVVSPTIALLPGPPPGFGPPGFPEPPNMRHGHDHHPPISPTNRQHPSTHTISADAPADLSSRLPSPAAIATRNSHVQPSVLTDILHPYSGPQIDHTTNTYVKLFCDTDNVQNSINCNNKNNALSHFTTASSYPCDNDNVHNNMTYNNNNSTTSHFTTPSLYPDFTWTCYTSAASLGHPAMRHPGISDEQPKSLHHQMFDPHKRSTNYTGNVFVSADSLQNQVLDPNPILVNGNKCQHQMYHHDLPRDYCLPRVQPEHQQSSSSLLPCQSNNLFGKQQYILQTQQQSDDNSNNVTDDRSELPVPFSLPPWLPASVMPPIEDGCPQSNASHMITTDNSIDFDFDDHSCRSSLGESSLPVVSALDNGHHTLSQFKVSEQGSDGHTGRFHQRQPQHSLHALQTHQQLPQRIYNIHNTAITGSQLQQFDDAGVARLLAVNHHTHPQPQVGMKAGTSNGQHDRLSFNDIGAGRTDVRRHDGISNDMLNTMPGYFANVPHWCSDNLSLPLPAVTQPACNSHLWHQESNDQQQQYNDLYGRPGFPPRPASEQQEQQYRSTVQMGSLTNNWARHRNNHRDLHSDHRPSIQVTTCTLASVLVQSELASAAFTGQQQKNVDTASHVCKINSDMDANVNCNATVGHSCQPALGAHYPGFLDQFLGVQRQPPIPSAVGANLQEQHKRSLLAHLTDFSGLNNSPAIPHGPPGVASQHETLDQPKYEQQQGVHQMPEQQYVQHMQPLYDILPITNTDDDMINTIPKAPAIAASRTGMTVVANDLLHFNDDDEDDDGVDDRVDDVDEQIEDEDEDEDVIIINAAAEAFIMDVAPDSDTEPQTPPTTTIQMGMAMYEEAKANACGNESSHLNPTLRGPSLSGVVRSPLSSSLSTADSSDGEEERGECGELDVSISPDAAAHVAKVERGLREATDDTFHSSFTWTEASLSQLLILELEDLCMNGAAILDRHGTSDEAAMGWHGFTGEAMVDTSVDYSQQQRQQQQLFNCFNLQEKQSLPLDKYIERLVSYANCSPSAFIVMLLYIDRVRQRCKYLQLNHLNVRRVVLAALLAAVKFVEDRVYSNAGFAYIGGEDVQDLNDLEYLFNQAAGWAFFVTGDEYKAFEDGLLRRWTKMNAEGARVVLPPMHLGVAGCYWRT